MAVDYELLDSGGEVNSFDWQAFLQDLADRLLDIALKLAYGIVILIIGWIIVSILLFILRRIIRKMKWDETLKRWLLNVVSALLKVILFTIVIGSIGIEVMSFTALISAMGMAIGLALSGIFQNFMSGVMIIVLKLIKVGEWIRVSNVEGVVEEIGIMYTKCVQFNRQAHFIPNDLIVNGVVTNYTRKTKRRLDLSCSISYREDIDRTREAIIKELLTDERCLRTPRPLVTVEEVDGARILLNVMPWIKTPDPFQYMGILWDMNGHILAGIQKADVAVGTGVDDVVYHFGPQPLPSKPRDIPTEELEKGLVISDHESDKEEDGVAKKKIFSGLRNRKNKHKKLEDSKEGEDDDDEEEEEEEEEEKEEEKKDEKKDSSDDDGDDEENDEKKKLKKDKSHRHHHKSKKGDGVEMDEL